MYVTGSPADQVFKRRFCLLLCFFCVVIGIFVSIASVLENVLAEEIPFLYQHCVSKNDPELEVAVASLFIDELGYTLIGAKPVSIQEGSNYYLRKHPEIVKRVLSFLTEAFKNSPRFILKISEEDDGFFKIELYCKTAVRKVIAENKELQTFIKNKFLSVNRFFSHVQRTKKFVFNTFDRNDFLFGLILGYGRDNSEYYCRRINVGTSLKKYPFLSLFSEDSVFSNNLNPCVYGRATLSFFSPYLCREKVINFLPKRKFASLEAEWKWIKKVRWDLFPSRKPEAPDYISLPFYICRHSGDSERVRSKYIRARERLANLFYKHSFTEIIAKEAAKSEASDLDIHRK